LHRAFNLPQFNWQLNLLQIQGSCQNQSLLTLYPKIYSSLKDLSEQNKKNQIIVCTQNTEAGFLNLPKPIGKEQEKIISRYSAHSSKAEELRTWEIKPISKNS
jgi:hypothetical protein